MKTVIVINEQHNLLPVQEEQLKEIAEEWDTFAVPRGGLSSDDQRLAAQDLLDHYDQIIFVSPVPLMLAETAASLSACEGVRVWLFVNDKREKKELPDGRVVSILSFDGWRLEEI